MGDKETLALWAKFHALRAAILAALADGVQDSDPRLAQARNQQRMIAEALVKKGAAKGIALDREGDHHRAQRELAAQFEREPETPGEGQVVRLQPLRFSGVTGEPATISPPPSQTVGVDALRMEGQIASSLGRELSALEGTLGVDYALDRDPTSGIVFYVPIGGQDD